ncbi:response regulator [Stenotrophomonas bentonitica]|jgi:CheY-like chemotaxis protein
MSALQGLRVLVVENDAMSASLLEMQLMHAGAVMIGPASSVAEALRLIEEAAPQIVLLDYRLANHETSDPVADALTALGIPFVVATGMANFQLPEAFRAGRVLTKPYLTAELNHALTAALQDHAASA